MRNILLALFIGILLIVLDNVIGKCFFEHENCPIRGANAEKDRGLDPNLAPDILEQSKRSASALNALDFKINYVYRPNGKGEFKDFGKGSVLHSGDHYKLMFEPSDNGYVYIFQIDSSNSIFRLFPTVDYRGADPKNVNAVIKGRKYFVPAEGWSFRLDKTIGKETIYFVVTRLPDANLENHYKTMLAQQKMRRIENRLTARQEWDSTMKLRGPEIDLMKDVTEPEPARVWQEGGKTFSADKKTYLRNMCDGCVYIVDFEHR